VLASVLWTVFCLTEKRTPPPSPPAIQPIVYMDHDLVTACAQAIIHYGWGSVYDFACTLSIKDGGLYVSVYGPDDYGKFRLLGERRVK
jgi:hypothetical protein